MVVTILCYYFRDHVFDLPLRVRGKKKRKASSVSQPNKPARGIMQYGNSTKLMSPNFATCKKRHFTSINVHVL